MYGMFKKVNGQFCIYIAGHEINFLARSLLAPKFFKLVAKAKKLGAIKKKKIVEKTHYTVASNGRVFLPLKWSVCATKKDISLHTIQRNIRKIEGGGCWQVWFITFMTILLNRPYRSHRFIYFKVHLTPQKWPSLKQISFSFPVILWKKFSNSINSELFMGS